MLIDRKGLVALGIKYTPQHLGRLMRAGLFPLRAKIGNRNYWVAEEVHSWIARHVADRRPLQPSL